MARYIDADKLIEEINDVYPHISMFNNQEAAAIKMRISTMPAADVVEVVRCKDCKYYSAVTHDGEPMHYGYCKNKHDEIYGAKNRYERDFCSYGEREEAKGDG